MLIQLRIHFLFIFLKIQFCNFIVGRFCEVSELASLLTLRQTGSLIL